MLTAVGLHGAETELPRLPALEIRPAAAYLDEAATVQLPAFPQGIEIRYTTDGKAPSIEGSPIYSTALNMEQSTVLRFAAFSGAKQISPILTRTLLFPRQVARQGFAPKGYPNGDSAWQGEPSHYGMDPRIVDDPRYRDRIRGSLVALPALSVVMAPGDLFGRRGIYLHTHGRGDAWERPASVEWIETNGVRRFQVDCGIRIQGNTGRRADKTPKHSFRLLFKKQYGPGKLQFRVFPDSDVDRFDTLVLRADYNNAWTHWKPEDNRRAQRTRDAFVKDTHRAMGHPAGHCRYVHLYLNGMYWGIYDIAERPDAGFAAAYMGGGKEDYDVLDESGLKSGNETAREELTLFTEENIPRSLRAASKWIDPVEYVDYLLLNYYVGNQDWGHFQNWYVVRNRTTEHRFHYTVWDGEITLQRLNDDVVNAPDRPAMALARQLRGDPEFRLLFADRVQKHCFGDGALTPQASTARWLQRAMQLDTAIIAESARWGYCRRDKPFERDTDWLAEQRRLVEKYFPKRTEVLLQQLKQAALYPEIPAPILVVNRDPAPTLAVQCRIGDQIYVTTDGSDPRWAYKGTPSETAQSYSQPIPIQKSMHLKVRSFSGNSWSALVEWQETP